jgi:hypothetical protein
VNGGTASIHSSALEMKWHQFRTPPMIKSLLIALLIGCGAIGGCSVYSVTTRPDRKDTEQVIEGASRLDLIAALGPPCRSFKHDDAQVDVFEVSNAGTTSRQRMVDATAYALLDVVTLGIGELWGSERESQARRECTSYTVTYGPDGRAKSIDTRQWLVEPPPSAAAQRAGYCAVDYHVPACENGGGSGGQRER